jgi:hypothetical protein
MRILFDQGTPVPLRRYLPSHVVDTVFERGWSALSNGELLDVAEQEGYALLMTTDQNLRYQQRLTERQLAIIVLLSTSWPRIQDGSMRYKRLLRISLPEGTKKLRSDEAA